MSDDVNITSGGGIAVDSSIVRDIGRRLRRVDGGLADACDLLQRAGDALDQAPQIKQRTGAPGITACAGRLRELIAAVRHVVDACEQMANAFELAELRAQQSALSVVSPEAAAALQARIDELVRSDPDIENRVKWIEADWLKQRHAGTGDQPLDDVLAVLGGPAAAGLASGPFVAGPVERLLRVGVDAADALGRGPLLPGARLTGAPPPVSVRLVAAGTVAPTAALKDSIRRIPYGRAGQVVVEKYTMKNGGGRFVAYIDGTRKVRPFTDDPWDMGSNWDMYVDRETAASQQAVLEALEQAGARPGDRVDLVGYSQGAAIASFTAMDGPYTTGTVITAGSPVEPWLTDAQTHVQLAHDGDLVANLTGQGPMGGSGSPQSITVSRDVDRLLFWNEHDFSEYVETAGLADASGDPRVKALHDDFFSELGDAESVERMEFEAKRP